MRVLLCGLVVLLLAVSAVLAQRSESTPPAEVPRAHNDELAHAPEKYRLRPNPMDKDPLAIPAGKILFEQHCAECHGSDAAGARKGPSLLRDRVQNAPPGSLFWLVTNGVVRRGMPVWSKIPEPERWQIIRFIKSLASPQSLPAASATPEPRASEISPVSRDNSRH